MFKLAISAGHYKYTSGKRCLKSLDPKETREWVLNDRIADKIEKMLASYDGIQILRLDDTTGEKGIELIDRSNASNKWGADFYLSIHHNAGIEGGKGGGIVAFVYTNVDSNTKSWQKDLYNELIKLTGLKGNRATPLASANLHECREPIASAVLLELGFMDSKTDVPIILTEDYATKCAQACVNVIVKKAGLKKKSTTTTTTVNTYKLITDVNKYTTAADAKSKVNSKGTMKAGTYYIFSKYPNGYNGMYNLTTDKTGAEAGNWINPAENIVVEKEETVQKIYRVRKSWNDTKSQKGAFSDLSNAKECCQSAGAGYKVFDWNGKEVYAYTAPAVKVTLSSIAVTTKPTKLTYTVGESLNTSGMVVTATYSDKSTKAVTGYTLSGFSSSKVGTSTVTVTFEGKTATFSTTIKKKETAVVTPKAVYELDYLQKHQIIEYDMVQTEGINETECTRAIVAIKKNNANFDVEIAKAFFLLADEYHIDPTRAISQSILETGWFKFAGSSVKAEQHNYCGLGATGGGAAGASFDTIENGVRAQLQHLYAYGCKDALPEGETTIVDPRFKYVTRGIATYWEQLAGRWAVPGFDGSDAEAAMKAGSTYGQKIDKIYEQLKATKVTDEDIKKYFKVVEPDDPKVDPVEPKDNDKDLPEINKGWLTNLIKMIIEVLFDLFRSNKDN